MARGDGIHRTSARNAKLTADKIGNAQAHNEREKDSYVNQDIVPERTGMNVHFKSPTADYTAMFDQMVAGGEPLLTKNGKKVLRKSYSVLQDDFYAAMRSAGYTDVERGERGSSEEHLSVTQFKVEKEQERLADLTEQTAQKAQEAASLEKKIEKIQKQKVDMDAVDKIEAKPKMLSSKVTLERSEYENLVTAAKKYVTFNRKEGKLKKLLELANKTIAELREKIATLTEELNKYKSVEKKLHSAGLEVENEQLRSKIRSYETAIERNNLWHLFNPKRSKTHSRSDAR